MSYIFTMQHRAKKKRFKTWTLLSVPVLALIVWILFLFFPSRLPSVDRLKTQYPSVRYLGPDTPPEVELKRQRPMGWVSLSEVSRKAVGAVVVSEDWAFYQHKGYDVNQITEVFRKDLKRGRFRGASTITQQVVRNVFLEKDKKISRKMKEVYLATRLEKSLNKAKILEIYLNIAEWGPGFFGIGSAAKFYFNKDPSQLNAREGAFLAMLLPSPKKYGVSFRTKKLTKYAKKTIQAILKKMVQARYLTDEELSQEMIQPLSFEESPSETPVPESAAPEELNDVEDEVESEELVS